MDLKDLVNIADKIARAEIERSGFPNLISYELMIKKGTQLAEKLNANIDIVKIGIFLMDIGLGEAFEKNIVSKHLDMGVEKTKEILSDYNLDEETKDKILNCVAAHHGTVPYICIEAEICANTDCYKFISPRGVFSSFYNNVFDSYDKQIEMAEVKLDEKYNIISLDIVREELEPYYRQFKELIRVAKETKEDNK